MKIPNSVESEKVVVSKLLSKDSIATNVLIDYDEKLFFDNAHKAIFKQIMADIYAGVDFDTISIHSALENNRDYKSAGGLSYLSSLKDYSNLSFTTHFDIVREQLYLSSMLETSMKMQLDIVEKKEGLGKKLDEYLYQMFELTQNLTKKQSDLESVDSISSNVMDHLDKVVNLETKYLGLPTGFQELDEKLLGLHRKDFTIVAARVSSGKSSFFSSISENIAVADPSKIILLFSLEMTKEQLVYRLIASIAHIPLQKLRSGNLSDFEWARFLYALDVLKDSKIYIDDTAGITPTYIHAKLRAAKAKFGVIDLVVVDYIQLMNPVKATQSKTTDVTQISNALKVISKQYDIPLIGLSQFSRAPEKRIDHRPQISDLRDSGSLEADADNLIFLYREELYNRTIENRNVAEIIVAKQRQGPLGSVFLGFIPPLTKFMNIKV